MLRSGRPGLTNGAFGRYERKRGCLDEWSCDESEELGVLPGLVQRGRASARRQEQLGQLDEARSCYEGVEQSTPTETRIWTDPGT